MVAAEIKCAGSFCGAEAVCADSFILETSGLHLSLQRGNMYLSKIQEKLCSWTNLD